MGKKAEDKGIKKSVKVLSEEEELALVNFINDIPTKYGMPIIKFLEKLKIKEI